MFLRVHWSWCVGKLRSNRKVAGNTDYGMGKYSIVLPSQSNLGTCSRRSVPAPVDIQVRFVWTIEILFSKKEESTLTMLSCGLERIAVITPVSSWMLNPGLDCWNRWPAKCLSSNVSISIADSYFAGLVTVSTWSIKTNLSTAHAAVHLYQMRYCPAPKWSSLWCSFLQAALGLLISLTSNRLPERNPILLQPWRPRMTLMRPVKSISRRKIVKRRSSAMKVLEDIDHFQGMPTPTPNCSILLLTIFGWLMLLLNFHVRFALLVTYFAYFWSNIQMASTMHSGHSKMHVIMKATLFLVALLHALVIYDKRPTLSLSSSWVGHLRNPPLLYYNRQFFVFSTVAYMYLDMLLELSICIVYVYDSDNSLYSAQLHICTWHCLAVRS